MTYTHPDADNQKALVCLEVPRSIVGLIDLVAKVSLLSLRG